MARRLPRDLNTPDGFHIETPSELISYWTFFVERECWLPEWGNVLRQQKNPLVLDVGANAGVFSHWIWTQNPNVELIAFEPLPKMADRIRKWQARTGAAMTLHNVAVSDHSGTAVFYAATDDDTGASLRPDSPKSMEFSVPLVTLDSAVPNKPILLAKIDVEGCEIEVLTGSVKTLANIKFLLVEAHTQTAFDKIRSKLVPAAWDYRKVSTIDYFFIRH